jgi:predicted aconitase with swiveling domain
MATASNLASRGVLGAFDSIAASTTGSSLVAAVPGCKIRVLTFLVNPGDTTASTVTFNSASTAKTPALKGPANGVIGASNDRSGLFETARGEALTVTTGAGSTTGVMVTYELIGNS